MATLFELRQFGRTSDELKKDLDYLVGVHERILSQAAEIKVAGEIYQDAGVIIRTIRDYFSDDIDEVLVDDKAACQQAIEFFKEIMPGCEKLLSCIRKNDRYFQSTSWKNRLINSTKSACLCPPAVHW